MMQVARDALGSEDMDIETAITKSAEEGGMAKVSLSTEGNRLRLSVDEATQDDITGDVPLFMPGGGSAMDAVLPWSDHIDEGSDDGDLEEIDPARPDPERYAVAAGNVYREAKKRGLAVRPSRILGGGYGLHTLHPIARRSVILYYRGRLICKPLSAATSEIEGTPLSARVTAARAAVRRVHEPPPRTDRAFRYMLELDLVHDMDGGTGGPEPYAGFLAAYSNSCRGLPETSELPSGKVAETMNMVPLLDQKKGLGPRAVRFIATREIEAGEELLWDYRFATSASTEEGPDPVYAALQELIGSE